jgi:hypothetical protein
MMHGVTQAPISSSPKKPKLDVILFSAIGAFSFTLGGGGFIMVGLTPNLPTTSKFKRD